MRKFLILLTILLGLTVFLPSAPAGAASAYIAIHNQGDSEAHIDVYMYVPASGHSYETNVYPGQTIGEPAYAQSNAEPLLYYNRASWCSKWWYQIFSADGSTYINTAETYRGGPAASGVWVDVSPDNPTSSRYIVRVKTWNC